VEIRTKANRIEAGPACHACLDQVRVYGPGQRRGIGRGLGNRSALVGGCQLPAQTVAALEQQDRQALFGGAERRGDSSHPAAGDDYVGLADDRQVTLALHEAVPPRRRDPELPDRQFGRFCGKPR